MTLFCKPPARSWSNEWCGESTKGCHWLFAHLTTISKIKSKQRPSSDLQGCL